MFTEIKLRFLGGSGPLNQVNMGMWGKYRTMSKHHFIMVEGYLTSSHASKPKFSAMPADIKFRAEHSDIKTY